MRVGILTQWYEPEPGPAALPAALARGLARQGHDVTVMTGFPNYPSGDLAPGWRQRWGHTEDRDGVRVLRSPLYPYHGRSVNGRVLNYASFAASATWTVLRHGRDLDVLWVNYSPISLLLPMAVSRLVHRTPMVCEVADLWPDVLLETLPIRPRAVRAAVEAVAVSYTHL